MPIMSARGMSALQGKLKCIKDRTYDMFTQVRWDSLYISSQRLKSVRTTYNWLASADLCTQTVQFWCGQLYILLRACCREAHEYQESGRARGKVILEIRREWYCKCISSVSETSQLHTAKSTSKMACKCGCSSSSGLPPQEAPVMIAEKRFFADKLFFSFFLFWVLVYKHDFLRPKYRNLEKVFASW